jgi:hypothetical protein
MYVRAVYCDCRSRLEAEDEETLRALVREHLAAEHATAPPAGDEQAAQIVKARAYFLEQAYAGPDDGTEEDFGPEPY